MSQQPDKRKADQDRIAVLANWQRNIIPAGKNRSALTLQTLLRVPQMYYQWPDLLHAHHVAAQNESGPPADHFKFNSVMF